MLASRSRLLLLCRLRTEPEKPAPAPEPPAKPDACAGTGGAARRPRPRRSRSRAKPEAPKKPAVVNVASTELFEFNKATLTPEARAKLDQRGHRQAKDLGTIRYINVNGHADRLGSPQYNQKLSEKRAEAVRAYLVSKGVDADRGRDLRLRQDPAGQVLPGPEASARR